MFRYVTIRLADDLMTDNTEWLEGGGEAYWIDPKVRMDQVGFTVAEDGHPIMDAWCPKVPLHFEGKPVVLGRGVPE